MPKDVQDIDRGWGAMTRRLASVDGLEAQMGILSGVPKYPKKRGKTAVARVAGVHGVHKLISKIWDETEGERAKMHDRMLERIRRGADPEQELLELAEYFRDKYRKAVEDAGLISDKADRGRLIEAIRASVFDGKAFKEGDDPKQPRMGNKGPFR